MSAKGTGDVENRFTTTVKVTDVETKDKGKIYTVRRVGYILGHYSTVPKVPR